MKNYTAKTLEELLSNVAAEKGTTVDKLTYTVTEEKKGLLGIGSSVSADVYANDDVKEFIFNYIGTFFEHLNEEASIEIIPDKEDGFRVVLNTENNAILIGKNGQTLQALNVVLRGAVNSSFKKRFNILIDVNNYKEDKYAKVKSIAKRVARSVQKTKVDASMDATMTNDERKVVHQFLADFDHIKTESEGDGRNRHLVIKYVENK